MLKDWVIAAATLIATSGQLASQAPVAPTRQVVSGVVELRHDQRSVDRAPKWSLEATPIMVAGGAGAMTTEWFR